MAYDFQQRTAEVEYFEAPDAQQIDRARRVVCGMATDSKDAEELLKMLGIHFSQDGVFDPVTSLPTLPTQISR